MRRSKKYLKNTITHIQPTFEKSLERPHGINRFISTTHNLWHNYTRPWNFFIREFHIILIFFSTTTCNHFAEPINFLAIICHTEYCAIIINEKSVPKMLMCSPISPTMDGCVKLIKLNVLCSFIYSSLILPVVCL